MCKLHDIFENIAGGATGAGSISGFRGALFVGTTTRPLPQIDDVTMSPYATTPNPFKRKKKPMKLKSVVTVKESDNFDTVTTSALKDLLRSKQRDTELRDGTEVFALEDSDGAIVKVYVKKDQADDFRHAVEMALANEEEQKEIAEILFDLHKGFEIVSVDWGHGSIPEDEEVSNSVDAEEQGFPDSDQLGDVEAGEQGTPDQTAEIDGMDGMDGDVGAGTPDIDGAVDQSKMLTQIIGLLQAQADATRAQADAAKAKADVDAAEAAARAAAQYSSYQEEVMDMENYNKRQQEDRRENQIQAKLLRYRHDLRKDNSTDLNDKLSDPEYLLNTLHKASIGESMNVTPPTPEEEEVLHMEDWEKSEKDKKQSEQLRDRMMRYKHAQKKTTATTPSAPEHEAKMEKPGESKFDPKTGSLMDYLMHNRQSKAASEHNAANQ